MKILILQLAVIVSLFIIICQAYEIQELKTQITYLKEAYEDMNESLDCVLAFEGKIVTLQEGRACLLPNGVWEALD